MSKFEKDVERMEKGIGKLFAKGAVLVVILNLALFGGALYLLGLFVKFIFGLF